MSSIFISYSSKDKNFVRQLRKSLFDKGIKIWIDESEIKVGDSLIEKISEGITEVEFLGAVLSNNSISSNWVKEELRIASTREVSGKSLKVLPILLDNCEIPIFLQHKKYADFRSIDNFNEGVDQLLNVLLAGHPMHLFLFGDSGSDFKVNKYIEEEVKFDIKDKSICHFCVFHKFEREPELADTTGIMFSGTIKEKKKFLRNIWYNQLCTHNKAQYIQIDYTIGKAFKKYKHCRDFNSNGNCADFISK